MNTIADLIAWVESNNNIGAVRFEPTYGYVRSDIVQKISLCNSCNITTARNLAATSFGYFQLMGESIYELGYKGTIQYFWESRNLQLNYFGDFIKHRGIDFSLQDVIKDPAKRAAFARHYNGNEIAYGARMLEIYNHYMEEAQK